MTDNDGDGAAFSADDGSSVRLRPKRLSMADTYLPEQQRDTLQQERLAAYREDLAEWLAGLFHMNITSDTIMTDLDNGTVLCQLAGLIEKGEKEGSSIVNSSVVRDNMGKPSYTPAPTTYMRRAASGSFQARDNVCRFIEWLKGVGVADSVLFEASDLVDHKNDKNVLYSLMELARIQKAVAPPMLVEIERNIDRMGSNFKLTDEEELGLEHDIAMILKKTKKEYLVPQRVGPGEYRFGHIGPFKVAKLRRHVMVRLPNTWDTLEHVLYVYDPTPTSRVRRRNSQVMDVVEDKERELSIAAALARRHSRQGSVSDAPTPMRRLSKHNSIEELSEDANDLNALRKRLAELEEALARTTTEVKALVDERTKLQKMYDEEKARTSELEAELQEAAASQGDQASLQRELHTLRDMNNDLKKKVSDMSDAVQASDYFKGEMERLRLEVKHLSERHERELNSRVAQAGTAATKRMKELEKEMDSLREQLALAQQAADAHQDEVQKVRDVYEAKLKEATASADAYTQELEQEHEKEVGDLEEELAQLRKQMEEAVAAARAEMQASTDALLEEQNAKHEKEKSVLEAHLHEQQDEQQRVLSEHRAERDRLSQALSAAEKEAETAKKQAEEHAAGGDTVRQELNAERAAKQSLEDELQELREQLEALKQRHAQELARVKEEAAQQLQQAQADHAQALATARDEAERTRKEEVAKAKEEAAAAMAAAQAKHEDALAAVNAQLETRDAEANKLSEAVTAAENDRRDMGAQVDALTQEKQQLEAKVAQANTQAETLQAALADRERELKEQRGALAAARTQAEEATEEARKQREAGEVLAGKLAEAEERAREAELAKATAAATVEARDQELETSKAAHEEELAKLRAALADDADKRAGALAAELEEAKAAGEEERKRVLAAQKETQEVEEQLAAAQHDLQSARSKLDLLELQQREGAEQAEQTKSSLEARVRDLEQQLLDQEHAAQEKLETAETHLRSTLETERSHYDTEVARLREQLEEARTAAATTRAQVEEETASKLEDAQRKLESVETLAASRKERYDNEVKLLRLRCMEAERKESSARLERDMLSQKMAALQARKEELEAELDTKTSAHRLKVEDLQRRVSEAETEARDRAVANASLLRRFREMSLSNLRPEDVDLICVQDEEARAANKRRLQARMELEEAEGQLEAARKEDAEHQTPGTRQAVEDARVRQQQAQGRLQQAEIAFHSAAERALRRLREEEEAKEQEAGEAFGADSGSAAREEMLLRAHADAQLEIARLDRELNSSRRSAEDAAADQIMALRLEHSSKIKELSDQRAADQRRLQDLQSLVDELRAQLDERARGGDGHDGGAHHGEAATTSKERKLFESVAEWVNLLLETDLTADTLIDELRDGKLLCQLANIVDEVEEKLRELEAEQGPSDEVVITRECQDITSFIRERDLLEVQYLEEAEPGNEAALSNIRAFIEWAQCLGIKYPSVFEEEDLVHDEDHRQVVTGIMDVAYRVRGLPLPHEVEDHRATAEPIRLPSESGSYTHVQGDDVDERVAEVLNFVPQMKSKLKRVSKGKYQLGNEKRLLLMRVLRDKVMVRVGGGWMDLEEYLVKHAERSNARKDYGEQAQATVQDILKSTGGPGLCSTRTKVPQRSPRNRLRKARASRASDSARSTPHK
ncbi:hypothetical protein PTSG_04078 [Salpingoeca rosetta]|uniref:Calponin-homology (CH) domain-containing protein n=1 Tax=Salpingoeca rosetta (strain ATCC 50818 / BSB-021) TaxID=946362 RepID=F2U6I8_SALR5|nr:uncharacterized protein PTSG_04078 [Salpingoeca rosetta]EGD83470.1 hypothetical protein PTSG_04078 [Salpingoeca rosetta]|eukprot:XP_004994974.1 hypothetical protein PTSG_04078 [Salpingoeca rosetta]